ncbi:hypothetical protein MTR67_033721 [Solanum verrucosum]|uniref:Uncharacterized protein n=1 Tax=Solanum verrucosum TaxID=315347 RepID=A0AAF0ZHT7_SOLVR|nr:hypothetical protein MTR67_033721 [Solanum verrucosum]
MTRLTSKCSGILKVDIKDDEWHHSHMAARSLFRYLKAYSWKFMASRVACNILGPIGSLHISRNLVALLLINELALTPWETSLSFTCFVPGFLLPQHLRLDFASFKLLKRHLIDHPPPSSQIACLLEL